MLLIAITQILFWALIGLLVLTVVFSSKGILSPKFTLLLFSFLGGAAFLCNSLSDQDTQGKTPTDLPTVSVDSTGIAAIQENDDLLSERQKSSNQVSKTKPSKNKIETQENEVDKQESELTENESSETEDRPIIDRAIPQEYEVVGTKNRTYRTKGSLRLGKAFMAYFEEKTGWKKIKNGNYEFELSHLGQFKQENGERERMYIYSGGELEIKVNGSVCCCSTIFSIPEGISDSRLVKAQEKLKQSISDLTLEHKESVARELQKCLYAKTPSKGI